MRFKIGDVLYIPSLLSDTYRLCSFIVVAYIPEFYVVRSFEYGTAISVPKHLVDHSAYKIRLKQER